jgi:hypothetical protein
LLLLQHQLLALLQLLLAVPAAASYLLHCMQPACLRMRQIMFPW